MDVLHWEDGPKTGVPWNFIEKEIMDTLHWENKVVSGRFIFLTLYSDLCRGSTTLREENGPGVYKTHSIV